MHERIVLEIDVRDSLASDAGESDKYRRGSDLHPGAIEDVSKKADSSARLPLERLAKEVAEAIRFGTAIHIFKRRFKRVACVAVIAANPGGLATLIMMPKQAGALYPVISSYIRSRADAADHETAALGVPSRGCGIRIMYADDSAPANIYAGNEAGGWIVTAVLRPAVRIVACAIVRSGRRGGAGRAGARYGDIGRNRNSERIRVRHI